MKLIGNLRNNQARQRMFAMTDHIRTLRVVIVALGMVVLALWWRNGVLQDTRRLYIPPDMTQGMMVDFGRIPSPTLYTFAYYIFQQLNRWRSDGEQDYPQQIYRLQGFLTPGCRRALETDMNDKKRLGELSQRERAIQEIQGHSYTDQRVQIESSGSWNIWLDVHVLESINGHPVKDVMLRYPLRVVRFDVDKEVNPWGLALACDEGLQSTLLTQEDIGKVFRQPREQR